MSARSPPLIGSGDATTAPVPGVDGRHHDRPDDRADDAAGTQLDPVAGDQAGEESADERPHETGDDGLGPVDVVDTGAEDELSDCPGKQPEPQDGEQKHGERLAGVAAGSVSGRGSAPPTPPGNNTR